MPSRYRVPAGWLVGLLVVALARPTPEWLLLGLPLAVVGEAVRLWASGHIEKTKRLATGGPYAHSRILYVGSLLMALGAATPARACAVLAVSVYFLAFYPPVMWGGRLPGRQVLPIRAWAAAVLRSGRGSPRPARACRAQWSACAPIEWRTAPALPFLAALLFVCRTSGLRAGA